MGQVNLNAGLMGYSSPVPNAYSNIKKECFDCGSNHTILTKKGLRCLNCGSLFVA